MLRTILAIVSASILWFLPPNLQATSAAESPGIVQTSPAISKGIAVPFEYFRRHIYITVSLQGKPGFIFMLDSGANRNILNLRTSKQLGIRPHSLRQEKNIGFGDAPVYIAPEEDVDAAIGSVPVASSMAVIDLGRFEQHFGHPADGMLGYPFFRRFVVKLDYQRKLLSIFPPDRYVYRGAGIKIALKPSKDFVIMPAAVGGGRLPSHGINAAVDTGTDATMMLYDRYVPSLGLEESRLRAVAAFALGLNGYYPIALGTIDSFAIGDEETHNLPVDYLTEDKKAASERNFAGAIGNGILQNFRAVIFDVPHERIIFEVKPPPVIPGTVHTLTAGQH